MAADAPIECKIKEAADAKAVSLSENVMREVMNLADQFVAYSQMDAECISIPDIAARFGTTEIMVRNAFPLAAYRQCCSTSTATKR